MLCGSLAGRGVQGRMDTWMCMAEFLCCLPETITTLLIDYTLIQNKKFFFLKKGVQSVRNVYSLKSHDEEN